MTETCRHCHRASSELRRRSHHIAVWCVPCADWCQPGQWIPHVVLMQRGIDTNAIADAPVPPTAAQQPSLFDVA